MRTRPKLLRLFQRITVLLLLLCSCYVMRKFYNWSDINAQSVLSAEEFVKVFDETYGGGRLLDVFELEDGGHIRIIDRPILPSSSEKLRAVRYADVKGGFHSYAALLTPKRLTRKDIDTSHWRVDRTVLAQNYYYYVMLGSVGKLLFTKLEKARIIEALSLSDLIKFADNCNAHILSVGLGGSTIDGFLHQYFPQMNITVVEISRQVVNMARKWFDLVENDYHRVVVSDGVKFIAEAVKKGIVFDAILLDACSSDQMEGIICPHESFLNEGVLKNIAHMLPKREPVGSVLDQDMPLDHFIWPYAEFFRSKAAHNLFYKGALQIWKRNLKSAFYAASKGILVVNVLSEELEVDDVYKIITKKFKAFFAYCNRLRRPFSINQAVYCSHQAPSRKPPINLQQLLNKTLTQSSISVVDI